MPEPQILSLEQVLLTTLVVKLAVVAALATMLARYRRFRHILIFERRDWPDRLIFVLFFYVPFYLYRAMRTVYGQGRFFTVVKFSLLGVGYLVFMTLTAVGLLFYTALTL